MRNHRLDSPRGGCARMRHQVSAALAIAVPLLAGCRETLTEVESGVVEPDTWPALKIERTLPGMADLIGDGRGGAQGIGVLDRWEATWDRGSASGGSLREEIYADARTLLPAPDPIAVRVAAESVRGALGEVRQFGGPIPPHLARRIEDARRFLGESEAAGGVEDWGAAGLLVLRAADALRETSPRTAALTLVEAAEDVLGPPPPEAGGEPSGAARARRLAWWSRIAIQQRQYSLAIQRGYYACLLLGVRLP